MESGSDDDNYQDILMESWDDNYEKIGKFSLAVTYITVFLVALWTARQFEAPFYVPILILVPSVLACGIYVSWTAYKEQQKRNTQTLLPSHGQSLNYGGNLVRTESDTPPGVNSGRNNHERQRRMSLLRAEEVAMKRELKYLEEKAAEAYQKHEEASNFLQRVKSQRFADNVVAQASFMIASTAWWAADAEQGSKRKGLQRGMRRLKEDMEQCCYNMA